MKEESGLETLARIVLRRKNIVILSTGIVFAGSLILSFIQRPTYESYTTLHLKKKEISGRSEINIFGEMPLFVTQTEINTQIEILKSRSMREEVARRLNLPQRWGKDLQEASWELKKKILIEPVRDTRLIKVTTFSTDPKLARDIAATLAQVAIERDITFRRKETTAALEFISEQVEKIGRELRETEEKIRKYKERGGFMELSTEAKLKVEILAEMESSYASTKIDREEMEVRLKEVREQLGNIDKTWLSSQTISTNPIVEMLRTQLTQLQIKLAQLSHQFPKNSPEVKQIEVKIKEIENRLRKEVETIISKRTESINPIYADLYSRLVKYETDFNALRAKEEALKELVEDYQKEVNKLPQQELELVRLERKRWVSEELYTLLLKKKSEARIQSASEIGSMEIVDPAVTPDKPVKPRKKLNGVLGLIGGLISGVGLAFLTEYLDKTIKTEEEVKELLKLPVLGVIPKLGVEISRYGYSYRGKRKRRKRKEGKDKLRVKKTKRKEEEKVETISLTKPKSAISEAYRILRTNLQFVDLEKKLKNLVVTSSIPKEGKTCVAANLAITFALAGEKTLLIDADFRNPGIHKIFELNRDPGLTNILTGRETYEKVINKKVKNLDKFDVLTTGPLPPNPSELLGSIRMKELISKLEGEYDKVIFDTPPSVTLTDASVLSTSVEGTLLVLGINEVEREAAQRAKEGLEKVKANILGVVLNKLVLKRGGYGSYYYYYYYYYYPQEEGK